MKLPYADGDIFAIPLGDGRTTPAMIVASDYRLVILRVFDVDGGTVATLRVSSDAIHALRWRRIDHGDVRLPVEAENREWMHAARAERIAGSRLGVALPIVERARFLEVRDGALPAIEELDGDTTLAWSTRLATHTLERIGDLVARKPTLRVRLTNAAVEQLAHLATWPLERLAIDGTCARMPTMESVRELDLFCAMPVRHFPRITKLRVYGRQTFDLRELLAPASLTHAELTSVHVEHPNRLLNCPALRTLRFSHANGLGKARHLALPQIQTLELDYVGELSEIAALGEMQQLEQLQLRGFWQHEIPEMEWLFAMRQLKRATIDIGGRRKNIELYRRANWAYPWPL